MFTRLAETHNILWDFEIQTKSGETSMNKQNMTLGIIIATLTVTAFAVTNEGEMTEKNNEKDVMTVAWYTANIRDARQKNKICYENKDMQSTEECNNALHALEISYKGI